MRSLVALFVLIGIVSVVVFKDKYQFSDDIVITKSDCHFEQGVCELALKENQPLRFELTPADLPAMEPVFLIITALSSQTHFSDAKVWLEGRDMNMGLHVMLPTEDQVHKMHPASSKRLAFKGMIPVCSVDQNMVWRLIIEFSDVNARQQIHFDIL